MNNEGAKKLSDEAKLENVVSKLAKAYAEVVKVVEASSDIQEEHVAKVFNFIGSVHQNSKAKSLLSIDTARASNGGFSLKKEYAPVADPILQPKKHVTRERLVGERKPNTAAEDDADGCGFIDD